MHLMDGDELGSLLLDGEAPLLATGLAVDDPLDADELLGLEILARADGLVGTMAEMLFVIFAEPAEIESARLGVELPVLSQVSQTRMSTSGASSCS